MASISDSDKKYQEILDKYARQMKPESQVLVEPQTEPVSEVPTSSPILSQTHELPNPSLPPIPPQPPPISSKALNIPIDQNQPGINVPPKDNLSNFFKFLFYISVLIFLFIVIVIVRDYFKLQALSSVKITEPVPETKNIVPETEKEGCVVNDNLYKVGETFDAADGCNQCECGPEFTILCSEKECP
ncbi:hypothetical protein KKC08_00970 [Patescibacteria group bacterium]|nr:hypothetical protein [Patescibacteria group bacterium]MCG2702463.1 hypothetical protein [Candidatus Parcubacteria bacterium]MBU4210297.1 hypothetical protein [Patescibacteria group bacterium]MBU4264487.1 hypothetical protein [Patescibacteria group bacterium]MBU4390418.1 hypothetical protein [Patescibacteria group bacterium]